MLLTMPSLGFHLRSGIEDGLPWSSLHLQAFWWWRLCSWIGIYGITWSW